MSVSPDELSLVEGSNERGAEVWVDVGDGVPAVLAEAVHVPHHAPAPRHQLPAHTCTGNRHKNILMKLSYFSP